MNLVLLTQSSGVLGPVAKALGWLMNGIYLFLDRFFNVQNVALSIIIFTVIVYMALLPLTIKQQKFSKLSMKMNPEIQAVQKKYQGRRDQASVNAMNEETQAIYDKYGVSPMGSCIYLVIQLPILFALYRVIYNIPGYIASVKNAFTEVVNGIVATSGYQDLMNTFYDTVSKGNYAYRTVSLDFSTLTTTKDSIVDVLYKCTSGNWDLLSETFPSLSNVIASTQAQVEGFNHFLGVSIVYSPRILIKTAMSEGTYIIILLAILIPLISSVTQLLNIRLMPQPAANSGQPGAGAQMKVMNYMMPIYSFILVFILPVGVGVYWIAGALIRCIQQFIINRHLDKIDMDALMKKNKKKAEEKAKKKAIKKGGVSSATMQNAASISTKKMDAPKQRSMTEKANAVSKSSGSSSSKNKSSSNKNSSNKNTSSNKNSSNKNTSSNKSSSNKSSSAKKGSSSNKSSSSSKNSAKNKNINTKAEETAEVKEVTAEAATEVTTPKEETAAKKKGLFGSGKNRQAQAQPKQESLAEKANKVREFNERNTK